MKSLQENVAKSTLALRLERNQKDVGQLRSRLNSYVCEPRTYSLFEKIEYLKHALERLSTTNKEIILSLHLPKKSIGDYAEMVREQFRKFHELQQGVDDYVRGASGY